MDDQEAQVEQDGALRRSMSRRELLAWMAAGGASAATVWSLARDGGSANGAPPATTRSDATRRASAAGASSPSTVAGSSVAPATASAATTAATASSPDTGERVLVVLELAGGNDGLSMVVPHGIGGYYDARPVLGIPASDVIRIDDELGFHPALAGIAARGAAIMQGIGSATPDGSHFEMMRRWWRGDPSVSVQGPGWIGRLADVVGDPDAVAVAVSVGAGTHPIIASRQARTLALPGADAAWYLAGADTGSIESAFQRGVRSLATAGGSGSAADLAAMLGQTADLAGQLITLGEEGDGGYPGSSVGQSLRFARQLFSLDVGVRVVHVVMDDGFDTHEGHDYRYPELMTTLDAAVAAFWADVDAAGLADRVALMTTSEFGRTFYENGSNGLDHGAASTMLVMGPVAPERVGEHPSLSSLDDNRDLIATASLDSYLGGVVEGWLGVPASDVFDTNPETLPIPFA